jgi:hypothetical protein
MRRPPAALAVNSWDCASTASGEVAAADGLITCGARLTALRGVTAGVIRRTGKWSASEVAATGLAGGGCAPARLALKATASGRIERYGRLTCLELTNAPGRGSVFGLGEATASDFALLAAGAFSAGRGAACAPAGAAASWRATFARRNQTTPATNTARQRAATANRRAKAFAVADEAGDSARPGLRRIFYNPFTSEAHARGAWSRSLIQVLA